MVSLIDSRQAIGFDSTGYHQCVQVAPQPGSGFTSQKNAFESMQIHNLEHHNKKHIFNLKDKYHIHLHQLVQHILYVKCCYLYKIQGGS